MADKLPDNNMDIQRRRILQAAACTTALLTANVSMARASKPPIGRVVIIGGGYAGTTAAKYIRMWSLGNIGDHCN